MLLPMVMVTMGINLVLLLMVLLLEKSALLLDILVELHRLLD